VSEMAVVDSTPVIAGMDMNMVLRPAATVVPEAPVAVEAAS
jgi:hypothetical protein